MSKNIEIISKKDAETIRLEDGDSAIIFRLTGENEAILGIGKDEDAKETRYAVAFCIYALSSGVLRDAFEIHMFDEIPS